MKTKSKIISKLDFILLIILFAFALAVYAQQDSDVSIDKKRGIDGPADLTLKTYEKNLKHWKGLSEKERTIIREKARKISPEQLKELRERFARFKSMPKEVRDRVETNFQTFSSLSPQERDVLMQRYQLYLKLPQEKQEELRHRIREGVTMPSGGPSSDPADESRDVPSGGPNSDTGDRTGGGEIGDGGSGGSESGGTGSNGNGSGGGGSGGGRAH